MISPCACQARCSVAQKPDELIAANPVRKVRRSRPRPRPVRPVAQANVEALRARLAPRDAIVVSVLAYAGLRPQEMRGLRW